MLKSGLRRIVLPRARARREPEKKPRDYVLLVWKALFMFLYHMDVHCTFRYILEPFFFCLWRATKLYSCLLQKVLKVTSNEIFLYQFAVFRFIFHIDQFIQLGTNRLNCCSKSCQMHHVFWLWKFICLCSQWKCIKGWLDHGSIFRAPFWLVFWLYSILMSP